MGGGIGSSTLLEGLDRRLARAVATMRAVWGSEPGADPFCGLYVGEDDVDRLLGGLTAPVPEVPEGPLAAGGPAWDRLARRFGLDPFDLDIILVALAPDIDLRYERIYAYLQNDVSRRRPTVDLVLGLLTASQDDKTRNRHRLAADAPLLRSGILILGGEDGDAEPPLLARPVRVEPQIVRHLLGETTRDGILLDIAALDTDPPAIAELPLDGDTAAALAALAEHTHRTGAPLRLLLHGPDGSGRRAAAAGLAGHLGRPLLAADLVHLAPQPSAALVRRVLREAFVHDAVPLFLNADLLPPPAAAVFTEPPWHAEPAVLLATRDADGLRAPLAGAGYLPVGFPATSRKAIERGWRRALEDRGIAARPDLVAGLAERGVLTPAAMAEAAGRAVGAANWRTAASGAAPQGAPDILASDLLAAAKTRGREEIGTLAARVEPLFSWDDIVVSKVVEAQLREICQRVALRRKVMGEWKFQTRMSLGRGVTALFSGESGTGKTMAAEVIASQTGLDLYKIDLSGVVSKYIGETEKNLERIFSAASRADAILFFDEADALFGKRSEVKDSHDRYANVEVAFLLQRMEAFEGLAILATNLRQNIDAAFTRRLSFVLSFSLPDEAQRLEIWRGIWPAAAPLAPDVDLQSLAARFNLTGGNIRNAAVAAAFLAAGEEERIGMRHILLAIRREYQKMGRPSRDIDALIAEAGT